MNRMIWVYRSFLQGILIGLFFVVLLSPNSGQIFPGAINISGQTISLRILDQSVLVLVFSGILGGLLYTIVVDGHVELPQFTSKEGDTFEAGLFGDLLLGIAGALVFEYLTTSLVITNTSTSQDVDTFQVTHLKLVAAQGIIGGYGGRAIMNMALKKFLNKIDKLEIEKRDVAEEKVKLEQKNVQLKQQLDQAEDEKIVIQAAADAPLVIASGKPSGNYDLATVERILEAEVDGAIHISKWSPELTQVVYVALVKLGFLDPSDTLEKLADGWKIFKESVNQSSPDMIGTGSAQLLLGALQTFEESSTRTPVVSSHNVDGISASALSLIKTSEGFESEAYADPGHGWNLPTIGYGTTKYPPNGRPVKRGDIISREEAEKCLNYQLEHDFKPALEKIPTWPRMNSNQRGALYSFAYNLGAGFYQGHNFDSITALCDNPDWWNDTAEIKRIFGLYNKSNGEVMPGLVTRRRAEADLFCKPAPQDNGTALVSGGQHPSKLLEHRYVSDPNPPLNVRSGPGTRFEKVGTLTNDTRVTVVDMDEGWLKISHPASGWISEKNTSKFLMRLTRDANPPTNVRSGPGQHFDAIHKLDDGTSIQVIDEKDGWVHLVGPVDGWISKKLVTSTTHGISGGPAPASMPDAEKYEHYRQLVLTSGGKFREGASQRNLIGFRKETSTRANSGKGEYDDRLFMVWKSSSGQYHIREYSYCTEPSGQYEHRSKLPHRRKAQGVDANRDGWRDLGRIPHGYYEYKKWSSSLHPRALRVTAEIMAERDTDHDGVFETHEPKAGEQQSMLFHAGGRSNTYSAGCQTFHPTTFNKFWSDLNTNGNPGVIGYTLVDWKV